MSLEGIKRSYTQTVIEGEKKDDGPSKKKLRVENETSTVGFFHLPLEIQEHIFNQVPIKKLMRDVVYTSKDFYLSITALSQRRICLLKASKYADDFKKLRKIASKYLELGCLKDAAHIGKKIIDVPLRADFFNDLTRALCERGKMSAAKTVLHKTLKMISRGESNTYMIPLLSTAYKYELLDKEAIVKMVLADSYSELFEEKLIALIDIFPSNDITTILSEIEDNDFFASSLFYLFKYGNLVWETIETILPTLVRRSAAFSIFECYEEIKRPVLNMLLAYQNADFAEARKHFQQIPVEKDYQTDESEAEEDELALEKSEEQIKRKIGKKEERLQDVTKENQMNYQKRLFSLATLEQQQRGKISEETARKIDQFELFLETQSPESLYGFFLKKIDFI